MAENETLGLWGKSNGRWRALLEKIRGGGSPDAIAEEADRCLVRTFKNLVRLLPLKDLLEAAVLGPAAVHQIARRCREGRA